MADGNQHIDNQTLIDHAKPRCSSTELFKSILTGDAHGVFSGRIIVRPDAQKTDARQSNKTLLLSKTANVDTRPQLEIFADDVRCTHGATIGRLDEEALFYLRSRGISHDDAITVLTFAFASDLISRVKPAALAEALDARIHNRFPHTL
jgi:Fe-S cluster assembly protein SufD